MSLQNNDFQKQNLKKFVAEDVEIFLSGKQLLISSTTSFRFLSSANILFSFL